jgi:hypothetical protein
MADPAPPNQQPDRRARYAWALPAAGGVLFGALLGLLLATRPGRVPAEGLIGIGSFLVLAGVAYSFPTLWRTLHSPQYRFLQGERPQPRSRAGQAASLVRVLLVARNERWREDPAYRRYSISVAITAGVTIILVALIR